MNKKISTLYFLIIPFFIYGILLHYENFIPFVLLLGGVLLGLICISYIKQEAFSMLLGLFIIGLILRVLIAILLTFATENGFFAGDGWCYSQNGWHILKLWESGRPVDPLYFIKNFSTSGTLTTYDFWNAFVYSFTGYSPLTLFFINCLAGSFSILLVYFIAERIFNQRVAFYSSLFVCFWPSFILWSTQNLKDALIIFWALFFIYNILELTMRFRFYNAILLLFSLFVLYYFGKFYFFGVIAALVCYVAYRIRLRLIYKMFLGIGLSVLLFLFIKDKIFNLTFVLKEKGGLIEAIDYLRSVRAYGNLAFLSGFKISSILSLLVYFPLGFIAVFFAPFPWQVSNMAQLLALPETVLWYILVPFTIKGILAIKDFKKKESYFLLFIVLVFAGLLALLEGNLGTMFRHRAIIMMILFIFTSYGLSLNKTSGLA